MYEVEILRLEVLHCLRVRQILGLAGWRFERIKR